MPRKALIVQGGLDCHEPVQVSQRFARLLTEQGFDVEVSDTLDAFRDGEKLKSLHLIIPVWTLGTIDYFEQLMPVMDAIASGVGMAGCHGGMCDAFRESTDWQFMTGGQWVAHPGNDEITYTVNIRKNSSSPIVDGIDDFPVTSEQYYVHVDPANSVLATTRFPIAAGPHDANGAVDVPVTWTRMWGRGRVFYTSLGHSDSVFNIPEAETMMLRGMLWAADGKDIATARSQTNIQ